MISTLRVYKTLFSLYDTCLRQTMDIARKVEKHLLVFVMVPFDGSRLLNARNDKNFKKLFISPSKVTDNTKSVI